MPLENKVAAEPKNLAKTFLQPLFNPNMTFRILLTSFAVTAAYAIAEIVPPANEVNRIYFSMPGANVNTSLQERAAYIYNQPNYQTNKSVEFFRR